jgi:hypothetical protein
MPMDELVDLEGMAYLKYVYAKPLVLMAILTPLSYFVIVPLALSLFTPTLGIDGVWRYGSHLCAAYWGDPCGTYASRHEGLGLYLPLLLGFFWAAWRTFKTMFVAPMVVWLRQRQKKAPTP